MKNSFYKEAETKEKLADFILKTDRFSMGEQCSLFEKNFAEKQGRRYAVFVSSGSAANLILIQSLLNLDRLKRNDLVAVSSVTWPTNIMPLIQLGLRPSVCDCELTNLNVSSEELKKNFSRAKYSAVFLTNVLGFSADISMVVEFCRSNNIILIEDNCESLGSRIEGKLLGNFGLASTFSTFVGHHLSTIEGGVICTDDLELYEMLLCVRAHGWDRNLPIASSHKYRKKYNVFDDFFAWYTFYDLAYNVRPNEINGFIGLEQLKFWDEIIGRRNMNFKKFHDATLTNPSIVHLDLEHMDFVSNFAMPLVFHNKTEYEKHKLRFQNSSVEIRPVIAGNIMRQPCFKKYIQSEYVFPNADQIHYQGFYFGNNPELSEKEVDVLCNLVAG